MSATAHFLPKTHTGSGILAELLHSVCQPLTTLRCSLELCLDETIEKQQKSFSVALQQTDQIIAMVELMREYVEAERPDANKQIASFAPVLRQVADGLTSVAAVRDMQLRLLGTCTARLPVAESRLYLALQYILIPMIEVLPSGGRIVLLLGQGPAGAVLRGEGTRSSSAALTKNVQPASASCKGGAPPESPACASTLRRAKLSIASRILEGAGASLVFNSTDPRNPSFVLRISNRPSDSAA